jgi:endonuclease III
MNPFAHFAFCSKSISGAPEGIVTNVSSTAINTQNDTVSEIVISSSSPPQSVSRKRLVEEYQPHMHHTHSSSSITKKKRKVKSGASNKSNPEIMSTYWIELRGLTSNYPFAVLLTGVLGAQTRDVVTVGVMKALASNLGGDINPLNICLRSFDELETAVKRLNYCHKKTRTMMDLAAMFRDEPVPSTMHGLKTVPGVGPVISEIILRVAFGANYASSEPNEGSSGGVHPSQSIFLFCVLFFVCVVFIIMNY